MRMARLHEKTSSQNVKTIFMLNQLGRAILGSILYLCYEILFLQSLQFHNLFHFTTTLIKLLIILLRN